MSLPFSTITAAVTKAIVLHSKPSRDFGVTIGVMQLRSMAADHLPALHHLLALDHRPVVNPHPEPSDLLVGSPPAGVDHDSLSFLDALMVSRCLPSKSSSLETWFQRCSIATGASHVQSLGRWQSLVSKCFEGTNNGSKQSSATAVHWIQYQSIYSSP